MAYVITSLCVGRCEIACARVCPVDAIHGPLPIEDLEVLAPAERVRLFPALQMYIDPGRCICCAACVAECPANAIFDEEDVPAVLHASIGANAAFFRRP
jgi:formate hydrogenlyase subunit 6/NADH:ubiquinone oxidoreductase subunit I